SKARSFSERSRSVVMSISSYLRNKRFRDQPRESGRAREFRRAGRSRDAEEFARAHGVPADRRETDRWSMSDRIGGGCSTIRATDSPQERRRPANTPDVSQARASGIRKYRAE